MNNSKLIKRLRKSITPLLSGNILKAGALALIGLVSAADSKAQYVSSTCVQNTDTAFFGMNNAAVINIQITMSSAAYVSSMSFSTSGTTDPGDLINAKLYYSNSGNFKAPMQSAWQVGSTLNAPAGSFDFTLGTALYLTAGTHNVWLTYDVKQGGTVGNTIDAECTNLVILGVGYQPSVTSPTGSRYVKAVNTFNYCTYPQQVVGNYQVGIAQFILNGKTFAGSTAQNVNYINNVNNLPVMYKDAAVPFTYLTGSINASTERIYMDLNNDGFYDATELMFTPSVTPTPTASTVSGMLSLGCNVPVGIHRMRIACDLNGFTPVPCGTAYLGGCYELLVDVQDLPAPKAIFDMPATVYAGANVYPKNSSTSLQNNYAWDFKNAGVVNSTLESPVYQYTSAGTFTAKLKVYRTICSVDYADSTTKNITVVTPSAVPVTEFISDRNITTNSVVVNFTDLSSNGASKWKWRITPTIVNNKLAYTYTAGTDSTSQHPKVIFMETGLYNVELVSENILGTGSKVVKANYIKNSEAALMCGAVTKTAEARGFIADEAGPAANYGNASHRLCTYTIAPCASSVTFTFLDFDLNWYQLNGCFIPNTNPQIFQPGDNLKIYDGEDATGIPLHQLAGFPNGFSNNTGNLPLAQLPPSVTAKSGKMYIEYYVNCNANGRGFLGEWTSVPANVAAPVSNFTANDTAYVGASHTFLNTSTGVVEKTYWDYNNDGITDANTIDGEVTFSTQGSQVVKLTSERCGIPSVFTKTITVLPVTAAPKADFGITRSAAIVNDTLRLFDKSTQGPNNWKWEITPSANVAFINGTTATSRNPYVQFKTTGTFNVKLRVSNAFGADSIVKNSFVTIFSYCTPNIINLSSDIGISRVKFGAIDNFSTIGTVPFTIYSKTTVVERGGTYPITIERNTQFNNANRKVWIDFDKNGSFEDAGEEVLFDGPSDDFVFTGSLRIAKTAVPGITRMRIGVSSENNDNLACGPNVFGEYEDYLIEIIKDITKPVITLKGANPMFIEQGNPYIEPGVLAMDNGDGDISNMVVTRTNININAPGTYWMSYNVTDAEGNVADSAVRTINIISDVSGPEISLIGGDTIYHDVKTTFNDPGATANDYVDGNVTNTIVVTGAVNANVVGKYYLTYNAKDLNNNGGTKMRVVVVRDIVKPVITLVGSANVDSDFGAPFADPGVTVSDNYYTNLVAVVSGEIRVNELGSYLITYSVTDPSGNVAASVNRTVTVKDLSAPVISLIGGDTVKVKVFKNYFDPGVIVSDNHTKNLTANVSGSVDTKKTGSYTLTYVATDSTGNTTTVKRIVNVIDDEAPVLSLNGLSLITIPRWSTFNDPGVKIEDNYNTQAELTGKLNVTTNLKNDVEGLYQVCYNVSDLSNNKAQEICRLVQVGPPSATGIELLADDAVTLYPNPNTGRFTLTFKNQPTEEVKVEVYTIYGALVSSIVEATNAGNALAVNLEGNAAGIYLVKITAGNKMVSKRVSLVN